MRAGRSCSATTVSYSVNLSYSNSTLLHRRENHRYFGKKPFSMALDEVRSGGTEGDNQIGWPIIVEVVEILDE